MTGRLLGGRYRLMEVVGSGGMAVVYRAQDMQSGAEVAVKVLREEYNGDAEFERRFHREARAAATMSHRNIVGLYDVGEDEGTHYIVMEFIRGMTLKDLIREKGRLRVPQAIDIAVQICRALEHAHANHIIHRDIKPQNIMVDEFGNVKVGDFGIARATNSQTVTIIEGGGVLGSVHYVSPEQARGLQADEASDLYSLGIVLYEMVTGQVPFDADAPVTVALKHIQEQVTRPRRIQPDCPLALEEVILKALAKDRQMRYANAREFENDLERVLQQPQGGFVVTPTPPPPPQAGDTRQIVIRPRDRDRQPHYDDYAPPPPPAPRGTGNGLKVLKYFVILAVTLGLIGGMIYVVALIRGSQTPTSEFAIKNVIGMRFAAARDDLIDQGLVVKDPIEDYSDVVEGKVFKQDPEAGTRVSKNDQVTLYVSKGLKESTVPELTGKSIEQAQAALAEAGLSLGEVDDTKFVPEGTPGEVYQQNPVAGSVVKGNVPVNIWVYKGVPEFAMPTVLNMTEDQARSALESNQQRQMRVTVLQQETPDAIAGRIVRQDPVEGTMVHMYDEVTVWVATNPATPTPEPTLTPTMPPVETPQPLVQHQTYQVIVPFNGTRVTVITEDLESGVSMTMHDATYDQGTYDIDVEVRHNGPGTSRVTIKKSDAEDEVYLVTFP